MRVCPADGTRLYKVDETDTLIGGVIDGRFRVDYTLGVGGMGTVYGGVQLSVNRDVAIKVLRADLTNPEVALERFFREAKTISKLSHPNIVKLIDFGQDRDRELLYLVMELVRGHNLGDLLAQGRLRTSLALDVVYQVSGALTEPHAETVIHRDLKPDNLLLVPVSDGTLQVKVLDFGIARFMESNTQLTGTGMICGTPAYMAPEQAQNERLDARTDLYALGVILYEMLSGWPPFSGTSSLQVMLKHIQETPPMLRELLPPSALPESIEEIVYALMSKDRSSRPKSARIVRDTIDALRKEFQLEPVRFEDVRAEDPFRPFILPKLPRATNDKSGPTQVLRRETGLDLNAGQVPRGISNDTQADPALGVTGPLSPEHKEMVAGDAKIKVATRGGGQQAWTPGDQAAVRSIKDTKDAVDVHGETAAAVPSLESPVVRKTLVEADDSEPLLQLPPTTEDVIEAAKAPADVTVTKERPQATSSRQSILPFILVALVSIGAVVAAAFAIKHLIDDRFGQVGQVAEQVEPPPLVEPPPATDGAGKLDVVRATTWAQRSVHDGIDVAARAKAHVATNAPDAQPRSVPKPKSQPNTKPKSDPKPKDGSKTDGKKDIDALLKERLSGGNSMRSE